MEPRTFRERAGKREWRREERKYIQINTIKTERREGEEREERETVKERVKTRADIFKAIYNI